MFRLNMSMQMFISAVETLRIIPSPFVPRLAPQLKTARTAVIPSATRPAPAASIPKTLRGVIVVKSVCPLLLCPACGLGHRFFLVIVTCRASV